MKIVCDKNLSGENKILLDVLKRKSSDATPFWLMRQAGRYLPEYRALREKVSGFLELCFTPELAAEVTLQPIRRFRMDAAIIFADILLIPKALGQPVDFVAGDGPVLEPIRKKTEILDLEVEEINEALKAVYETISIVKGQLPKAVTLIGFAGSPWTVACYMVEGRGSKEFSMPRQWALAEPEAFSVLINLLVDATSRYLIEQIRAGAEVVQLFDTWCGVLSETEFVKWVIGPTERIVKEIRKEFGDVPIIGFPKGAGINYKQFVEETGVTGVSVDHSVPLRFIKEEIQGISPVQGNLDPKALVVGGLQLEESIERIDKALGRGKYIFNLGHGIAPDTPIKHVEKLAEIFHNQR